MNRSKLLIINQFLMDHPESASVILAKADHEELAVLLEESDIKKIIASIKLIPLVALSEALVILKDSKIVEVLHLLGPNIAARVFRLWSSKSNKLKGDLILSKMNEATSKAVKRLVSYSENRIGFLMNPLAFTTAPQVTVKDLLKILNKEKNRYSRYVYVVNSEEELLGVLPFKDVFYAPRNALVSELMTPGVFSLSPELTLKQAYKKFEWRGWDSIPVTNSKNILLGVLRYDVLEDHLLPKKNKNDEVQEDIHKAGDAVGEVFKIGVEATVSLFGLSRGDQ